MSRKILSAGLIVLFISLCLYLSAGAEKAKTETRPVKKLVYLISDQRIPFWDIMWRGCQSRAEKLGYEISSYSAENSAEAELRFAVKAIREQVAGIIVSPTNSSACVTILKLARQAGIPVVISDIGTDSGDFVSFISSDNENGAYRLGQLLARKMRTLGLQEGVVGIIAIPQKRANGKARTRGFMRALDEAGIKGAGIRQQESFCYQETYKHTKDLIAENPNLRAIWLQGSDRYQGALDAIADAGRKDAILLICFDAEPEFLDLIPAGILVGAGMQQPFLMGERAVETMDKYLHGHPVEKVQKLPVLVISEENIRQELPLIRRNVLGLGEDQ